MVQGDVIVYVTKKYKEPSEENFFGQPLEIRNT